jgi:murein L,D-transpeptidase YcbB/YkuD
VPALRARLGLPAGADERFDAELDAAVRAFQQSQGLAVDGLVGPNTLDLLNVTDAERITRIDVNLERWRWLMRALPATRVQVNVADYSLQVFDAGQEALRMNVIVGTPFRRTPVFTEPMRYLVFNPDWRVPRRIAVEDKLPLLQKDATALAAQGYEARRANSPDPLQPVDAFDWSTVTPRTFDYLLRQRPGANNALGRVKFILPNPYSVYLHDTPARELFARSGRAFSSGCIRLEHAMLLADWVLRDQPAWTRERIDAVLEAGETVEVPLLQPLPVLVLYFTVVAGESGTVYYRPDLYGRDAKVAAALEGRGGSAAAGPG